MLYQKSIIMKDPIIIHTYTQGELHGRGLQYRGCRKVRGRKRWRGGLETGIKAELGIVKLKINLF
jgi:hypothetical protein